MAGALLLRAFVSVIVTLVLADADTAESVDESLRLFCVCVGVATPCMCVVGGVIYCSDWSDRSRVSN